MLYKQTIRAGEVREINKEGRQIKIINCESTLQMRVFLNGENLLDTEVRSGFDVTFGRFDKLTIQSDQEQRIELWASENPLGYEAPTKGSNSNRSDLIEHYGGSQKILPFERNRVAITLFSDTEAFWYGGEGVTVENGIPVKAGESARIEGAGEMHIAINKPPLVEVGDTYTTHTKPTGYLYYTVNIGGTCFVHMSETIFRLTNAGFSRLYEESSAKRYRSIHRYNDSLMIAERIDQAGFFDVYDSSGLVQYQVTKPATVWAGNLDTVAQVNGNVAFVTDNVTNDPVTGDGSSFWIGGGADSVRKLAGCPAPNNVIQLGDRLILASAGAVLLVDISGGIPDLWSDALVQQIDSTQTIYSQFAVSSNDEKIMLVGRNRAVIVDRTNYNVSTFPTNTGAGLTSDGRVVVIDAAGKVSYSSDNGSTFIEGGQVDIPKSSYDVIYSCSDYFVNIGLADRRFSAIENSFLKLPQAQIRMLKEVI